MEQRPVLWGRGPCGYVESVPARGAACAKALSGRGSVWLEGVSKVRAWTWVGR